MKRLPFIVMMLLFACKSAPEIPENTEDTHNDNADYWHQQGVNSILEGDYGSALHFLEKALTLDSMYAPIHSDRGIAFFELGMEAEATKHFKRALELDETMDDVWFNLAMLKQGQDSILLAMELYSKALEINPNLAEAWFNRAVIFMDFGNTKAACNDFSRAAELKDQDAIEALQRFCK
jgi:Flp pilus assembly protein TadD